MTWLLLALLGGAFGVNDMEDLMPVLLFMLFGVACLLSHELGHALCARWLYGDSPRITLGNLGGVTQHSRLPLSRWQELAVVAAGPFATLLPGAVGALLLGAQLQDFRLAWGLFAWYPLPVEPPASLVQGLQLHLAAGELSPSALMAYLTLFSISLWWCLFNLFPIFPLDGGRLLGTLTGRWRPVFLTGIVLSLALLGLSLFAGLWFNVMLMGFLAYINFQMLKQADH